jgi:pterin-4a-carbinolamine dehydratase
MADTQVKKNKFDEYNKRYENVNNLSEESESEDEHPNFEELYYNDTINIIGKALSEFVDEKSLPLCEYLGRKSIKDFLKFNFNF